MTSRSLYELRAGVEEVRSLRKHVPSPSRARPHQQALTAHIALQRACTVLLCSHLERYIYSLNEEATDWLNSSSVPAARLPEPLLLIQSKSSLEEIAQQDWIHRAGKLRAFSSRQTQFWQEGATVDSLVAAETIAWMKAPKTPDLIRLFGYYGIDDIFQRITRKDRTFRELKRDIQELVDSRNGIAHGDATVQPGHLEVTRYLGAVQRFCERTDKKLSTALAEICSSCRPW